MDEKKVEALERARSEAMDAILGKEFKTYDKGFIRVVDYMGTEDSIVQAARVSYGRGTKTSSDDRGLIRYLMRHSHTTPFEMCEIKLHVKVPMDTWRQWIRHRTACLAGDTVLQFDLPGRLEEGRGLYTLTVREVFERFQPTENTQRPDKQKNPYFKRERVQGMKLRCVDEETQAVRHTNVVDVWETGIKPVYRVEVEGGAHAKMSRDHLCLTSRGWLKLCEFVDLEAPVLTTNGTRILLVGPGKDTGVEPRFNTVDPATESWRPVVGWENYYAVSDQGRVRRVVGGRGSRSFGRCKQLTPSRGHAVVSLNKPGIQVVKFVHALMLESFVGPPPEGMEGCHNDGNGLNNRLDNLRWGTPKSNGEDRVRDDATTSLRADLRAIMSVQLVGEEMTYDLEVSGPWHNFSANGLVVHNSVNEYSTRYSEAIDDMAVTLPGEWRFQSGTNKQGSSGFLSETQGALLSSEEAQFHETAKRVYRQRLDHGVAREQARKDLPLSNYTEAYWKIDLHNLMHGFLSLRLDRHAQLEIRQCAAPIHEVAKAWVPNVYEAFEDYDHRRSAVRLSRLDAEVIRYCVRNAAHDKPHPDALAVAEKFGWLERRPDGTLKDNRERAECEVKLERLGLEAPWRDLK